MFKKVGKFFAIAAIVVALPFGVYASSNGFKFFNTGDLVYLGADEVINDDYLAAGERVDIAGQVDGDVIAVGGMVTITGSVSGDVLVAGGNVQILGPVKGDVRVVAGDVRISGIVGGSVTLFAGNAELTSESIIGRNLMAFAGNLDVRSDVQRSIRAAVGAANINSEVGRNVWLKFGEPNQFIISPEAEINGDLVYSGPSQARVLTGATIKGAVNFEPVARNQAKNNKIVGVLTLAFLGFKLTMYFGLLLLGLLLIWAMPKGMEHINKDTQRKFGDTFWWGLLAWAVIPMVGMILLLTVIGWLPGVLTLMAYALAYPVAIILTSYVFGDWLLRSATQRHFRGVSMYASFAFGLLGFIVLSCLPFIGWIFHLLAVILGFGIIFKAKRVLLKSQR